jgi:hypothetical protein
MQIEQLRKDIEDLIHYIPAPSFIPECDCKDKCGGNKACIHWDHGQYIIYIAATLGKLDRIRAEAHELGHIYYGERLIKFYPENLNYFNPENMKFLLTAINNAVSHLHIVTLLERNYNIDSSLFQSEYEKQLKSANLGDQTLKYKFGVALFDFERCFPGEIINNHQDPDVKLSYESAGELLAQITPNMDKNNQLNIVKSFLENLGYDSSVADRTLLDP